MQFLLMRNIIKLEYPGAASIDARGNLFEHFFGKSKRTRKQNAGRSSLYSPACGSRGIPAKHNEICDGTT